MCDENELAQKKEPITDAEELTIIGIFIAVVIAFLWVILCQTMRKKMQTGRLASITAKDGYCLLYGQWQV